MSCLRLNLADVVLDLTFLRPFPALQAEMDAYFATLTAVVSGWETAKYKGFNIIWDHISHISQPCTSPYAPCAMLCLVAMRLEC